jgi:hypothetical protein
MAWRIASSCRSRFGSFALAVGLCVAARSADAETADRAARAQQLFDEARGLMKEGNFAEACSRFAESQSVDPGSGTLLNLAVCHYRQDRTATAWAELRQALLQARRDGRADREKTAQKFLDELYPLLSRLTVNVRKEAALPGLSVAVDGKRLSASELGEALPFDPGTHEIVASAEGRVTWSTRVTLAPGGDRQTVELPVLDKKPVPAKPAVAAPAEPPKASSTGGPAAAKPDQSSSREKRSGVPLWIGYASFGVGAAALGVGTYFGISALSRKDESDRDWDGERCTQQACIDAWNDAKTDARISEVAIGVSLLAFAGGAVILLTAAKQHHGKAAPALSIRGARTGGGVVGQVAF